MLTYMMHVSTHTHTWTHTLQHTSILQCMHAHTHGTHTHARMHVHTCKMLFFYISSSFCLLLSSKRIAKERAQCLSSLSGNQEFASLLSFKDCQFALHSSLYSSLFCTHMHAHVHTQSLYPSPPSHYLSQSLPHPHVNDNEWRCKQPMRERKKVHLQLSMPVRGL